MRIFHSLDNLPEFNHTIFTQGTFDGVHIGHQKILETLVNKANEINGESLLLTFWPHPRLFLFPDDNDLKLLQTLEEKLEVLEKCGIDNVIVLPFTKAFSHILPLDYIKDFLVNQLNVNTIIVGYDHCFGRNREGDIALLNANANKYKFNVEEIPAKDIEHIAVSSTKIRNSLQNGDIDTATKYLGRYYSFIGKVVHGRKLGRTLGYPTANIEINEKYKLIPAIGVYAVKCIIDNITYNGMMNIGFNPTIVDKGFSVEVNIFEFEADIYDKEITVLMVGKIRDEKKFDNLDTLVLSLQQDKIDATKLFNTL